jgi:nickel-dependent lactate racemase
MVDRVEPSENEIRADMEEIARAARLDFVVNGVINSRRELAGLFAGDMIAAHRAAVDFARQVYATALPPLADVVVFNAYPKDTNLLQSVNAFYVCGFDVWSVLKPDGSGVLAAACSDGAGINYLESYGMRGYFKMTREMMRLKEHGLIIYSPNLSYHDVKHLYPSDTLVLNHWTQVVSELVRRHGERASVMVFPWGAIQIPARD